MHVLVYSFIIVLSIISNIGHCVLISINISISAVKCTIDYKSMLNFVNSFLD